MSPMPTLQAQSEVMNRALAQLGILTYILRIFILIISERPTEIAEVANAVTTKRDAY